VAVDIDYTNPSFVACLAHVNASDLSVQFHTPGTTQYQLLSGCPRQTGKFCFIVNRIIWCR
jgi:hypothetical protein